MEDSSGNSIIHAAFSSFQGGTTPTHPNCQPGADGAPGVSCAVEIQGDYSHTYNLVVENIGGTTWRGSLVDTVTSVATVVGEWTLPKGSGKIANEQVGFVEYFNPSSTCNSQPFTEATFYNPTSKTSGASEGKITSVYDLDPPRIAAISGAALDVVIQGEVSQDAGIVQTGSQLAVLDAHQDTDEVTVTTATSTAIRNPQYGEVERAMENYTHMDPPNTSARGHQLIPGSLEDNARDTTETSQGTRINLEDLMANVAIENMDGPADDDIQAAVEVTQRRAEQGDAEAQFLTGVQYDAAADQGHAGAQNNIGKMHEDGHGVPRDPKIGLKWYLKAAQQEYGEAQCNIGKFLDPLCFVAVPRTILDVVVEDPLVIASRPRLPQVVAPDDQMDTSNRSNRNVTTQRAPKVQSDDFAQMLFNAKQDDASAKVKLGTMYQEGKGGAEKDFGEALHWYLQAALQGNAEGQHRVGQMHSKGLGVPSNQHLAMEWYQKAAEQGSGEAQNSIGDMYKFGYGVTQYYMIARGWFLMSAEQGNPNAQTSIGYMFKNGEGERQDYSEAMEWFLKAADGCEHAKAQVDIGELYEAGHGVKQDYSTAMKWYLLVAEQEDPGAQGRIGDLYLHGLDVPQRYSMARDWIQKAADQGHPGAEITLHDINKFFQGNPQQQQPSASLWVTIGKLFAKE
ncbi:hypothetical protein BGW39_004930 [Mortierella sp. 14UC]|nr:hypothetical protein BGW39_004930 [Mortierella sp. 14UC]